MSKDTSPSRERELNNGLNIDPDREGNFRALDRLKQEADGVDTLLRFVPEWAEDGVQWLFEFDYLERRQQLMAKRAEQSELHKTGCSNIRQTFGGTITRTLNRRNDGKQPRFDPETAMETVGDAKAKLDSLYDDLDQEYLTLAEQRELQALEADIDKAREYLRNKIAFDEYRAELEQEIEIFERRFEPYDAGQRYMISEDQAFLSDKSEGIFEQFRMYRRELTVHLLPEPDAEWFGSELNRFEQLSERLPTYNEWFVETEREKYSETLVVGDDALNDQQQKAVIRNDIRNLVDASAGTGKTKALTGRYLYLLEKGHAPSDIVAITYTRDARDEMKRRISDETGIPERELQINTIHGFGNSILDQTVTDKRRDTDPGDRLTELVDHFYAYHTDGHKKEWSIVFADLCEEFSRKFSEFETADQAEGYTEDQTDWKTDPAEFHREKLEEFVDKARSFDLSPADIESQLTGTDKVRDTFAAAGQVILEAYLDIVESEDGPTDYDEMIYGAAQVVEQQPEEFQSQYDHILVDEFQDVSDGELRLIDAFIDGRDGPHLFCVGDDWQSIYGFAGSDVRNFTQFAENYTNVTQTELQINYRCPPDVVAAGVDMMAQSEVPQNDKDVKAHTGDSDESSDEQNLYLHTLDGYRDTVEFYATNLIQQKLAEGYGLGDIKVIASNDEGSKSMGGLRDQLERHKIPHTCDEAPDYLPDEYRDSLEYPVTFDDGDAQYATDPAIPDEIAGTTPPIVSVQSIHASKGTEEEVVILLDAIDDDTSGLPRSEREDRIIQPANHNPADRLAEERRLCYVALTRCESEFHAISNSQSVSRYLTDVADWFTRIRRNTVVCGQVRDIQPHERDDVPTEVQFDCDETDIRLVEWDEPDALPITTGKEYVITDIAWTSRGDVRIKKSQIDAADEANFRFEPGVHFVAPVTNGDEPKQHRRKST